MKEKEQKEMVNGPKHYCLTLPDGTEFQVIEYIESVLSPEQYEGFLMGNNIKYMSRTGKKFEALEDLKKAEYFNKKLIEFKEKDVR